MANEAKYNEIAGVNKKEQEKKEKQQKREDFVDNVQDNIKEVSESKPD